MQSGWPVTYTSTGSANRKGRSISFQIRCHALSTITNTALLMGLQARDDPAWTTFYSRYQPVLVAFGKRLGLRESDAQDAAQEALLAFADGFRKGQYDLGLEIHRAALATYEQINARSLLAQSLHDMGRLHLDLGDALSAVVAQHDRGIRLLRFALPAT